MATVDTATATVASAVAYTGGIGTVVVEAKPVTLTAVTLHGGAAGATFRAFDNATTNSGTVLFAATVATATAVTIAFPVPLSALNGVTINASAAGGAGSIHAY